MQLNDQDKVSILLEAYKKHSRELLDLEGSQQNLVTILLGIFAAGITFISNVAKVPGHLGIPLIMVAILLTVFGGVYTHKRDKARTSIRYLIVSIEDALGFYENGFFAESRSLYKGCLKEFPKQKWLGTIYHIVLLAGLAFVFIVVYRMTVA